MLRFALVDLFRVIAGEGEDEGIVPGEGSARIFEPFALAIADRVAVFAGYDPSDPSESQFCDARANYPGLGLFEGLGQRPSGHGSP